MRAAPDFLAYVGGARLMEQRWAAAAEHAADRIGGADPVDARCALASALVKVARLTPAAIPQAEPISTLIAGGDIAARVQRLLSDDPLNAAATSTRRALTIATAIVVTPLPSSANRGPGHAPVSAQPSPKIVPPAA